MYLHNNYVKKTITSVLCKSWLAKQFYFEKTFMTLTTNTLILLVITYYVHFVYETIEYNLFIVHNINHKINLTLLQIINS